MSYSNVASRILFLILSILLVGCAPHPAPATQAELLPNIIVILADDAGYVDFGKWHLGLGDMYHPKARGFDEFYGFLAGARSYFPHEKEDVDGHPRALLHNRERVSFEGYLTDVFGDQAVDFIEKNKAGPFFMYLAFNAVHTPLEAKAEHLEKYRDHPRRELAAMTWSMDENIGKVID